MTRETFSAHSKSSPLGGALLHFINGWVAIKLPPWPAMTAHVMTETSSFQGDGRMWLPGISSVRVLCIRTSVLVLRSITCFWVLGIQEAHFEPRRLLYRSSNVIPLFDKWTNFDLETLLQTIHERIRAGT